ncbi:MAG: ABC transporter permease [Clostridia bacterium]|nr:ABC transporter permease [Clostridia bacterium]
MSKNTRAFLKTMVKHMDVLTILLLSLALTACFLTWNRGFLSIGNISNIIQQNAALIIVSVGMTFVVISGNIDLSSGSLIVLTACLTGVIYRETGSVWLGIAACAGVATMIAAVNAALIAYGKINAVIITLACMIWARGLALGITGSKSIPVASAVLQTIYRPFAAGFFNISLILVVLCVAFGWFLLTRTKFGRYTKAIGENEHATELTGVHTRFIKFCIFTLAGFLTGIASLVDLSRLGSAVAMIGYNMEMNAIVAVVIGGNKLSGGEGSFAKMLSGLLFMCLLTNGLATLGLMDSQIYLLKGAIILAALAIQRGASLLRLRWLRALNAAE